MTNARISSTSAQLTILIIEDDRDSTTLVSHVLLDEGYQALTANDGHKGLALAEEHLPDLIICDIMMPGMDGYSVLRALRNRSSTATIPFIFLTALNQHENRREGMDLGADDYLTKPIRPKELIKAVEARLRRDQQFQTEQIQQFAQQLVQVQENERQHIAMELQNRINQTLLGLKLSLNLMETSTGRDEQLFEDSRAQLDKLIYQVESMAQEMHPTILEHLGLMPAVRWLIGQYDLDITLSAENINLRFDAKIEITLFRTLQSALNNLARHAGVRAAQVSITYADSLLKVTIEDHGVGFDLETALHSGRSAGLIGMYERAAVVGGHVEVVSHPGLGTRVEIELPLPENQVIRQTKSISPELLTHSLRRSASAPKPAPSDQEITVAIAIEQSLQRQGLRRLLESNVNLRVVAEVRDLQQTATCVEKFHPNVLIINPNGDGKHQHELLESIITASPGVQMLIIATRIDPEYVIDALQCGALGYISSSATMTDLHTAIVNVARGQMYLTPTIKQQDILARLKPRA